MPAASDGVAEMPHLVVLTVPGAAHRPFGLDGLAISGYIYRGKQMSQSRGR